MDNKTNLKIKKYNMIMWSFLGTVSFIILILTILSLAGGDRRKSSVRQRGARIRRPKKDSRQSAHKRTDRFHDTPRRYN